MQEKLDEIDIQVIDELARVNEERDRIRGFRERAEDKKDDVEEDVYRRVMRDYDARLDELEDEARPLREQGRIEYRKLAEILESLDQELEDGRSRKQELQFRHDVGEISDDDLEERLEEPDSVIERCEAAITEVNEVRDRFVEAFGSEEELEATEPEVLEEEPEAEEDVEEEPDAEDAEEEPGAEEENEEEDVEEEEAAEEAEETVDAEATVIADASFREAVEAEAAEAESEATVIADASVREAMEEEEEEEEEEDAAATVVAPNARLVGVADGDGGGDEYPLGPLNYVGRAPDNHVSIEAPAVSRKHALITASANGFVIEDLGSPNGTFVNDEEIDAETELHDGDSIKFGNVEFRFCSP